MVSVLFLNLKTAAQYCSAVLSYAQCSAEVSHRLETLPELYIILYLKVFNEESKVMVFFVQKSVVNCYKLNT